MILIITLNLFIKYNERGSKRSALSVAKQNYRFTCHGTWAACSSRLGHNPWTHADPSALSSGAGPCCLSSFRLIASSYRAPFWRTPFDSLRAFSSIFLYHNSSYTSIVVVAPPKISLGNICMEKFIE